jgi:hypothetical protein
MSYSTVCASDLSRWPSACASMRRKRIHGVPSQHYVWAPLGCEEASPVPRAATAGGVVRDLASTDSPPWTWHAAVVKMRRCASFLGGLVSGWGWRFSSASREKTCRICEEHILM